MDNTDCVSSPVSISSRRSPNTIKASLYEKMEYLAIIIKKYFPEGTDVRSILDHPDQPYFRAYLPMKNALKKMVKANILTMHRYNPSGINGLFIYRLNPNYTVPEAPRRYCKHCAQVLKDG